MTPEQAQSLADTECVDERRFVQRMERFVQTANVWSKRLAEAKLGQVARNTLREYVEMGRPFTASVVTQLLDFADKFVKDNLYDLEADS